MDPLLDAKEQKRIAIKNCWQEGNLGSQERYCSYAENFLITVKK